MAGLITDEMVSTFAVVGAPDDIPALVIERFGGVVDRVSFYAPYKADPEKWKQVLAGFAAS
jgi:hypothetical protein